MRAAMLLPLAALLTLGAAPAPQPQRALCTKPGHIPTGYCTMVMFYSDSVEMPQSGRPIVDRVVSEIADNEGATVVLAGYTTGGATNAAEVSRTIARNVSDYLIQQGVDEKAITIEAYAPAGKGTSGAQRRRVEIWVMY